ncbi:histidine phosphatase family protein [Cellulomonas shaoxiangyii]|uniref:Histidine phosphatase family protein n=1 Tax=Cellulomonas shaoxiangyii TaxID=2566013 RepID=A0A4V1CMZ5_9CELL|nr:histidine phosphatase family protein [Cellulomonas shaoxiangyii]QCB94665.1 histidine phosphatase family protein [Cellulomonas shaoxiangyii]TGY84718.1 histidine phosphatase family protein [Cellulomonas shaoxiangyii]
MRLVLVRHGQTSSNVGHHLDTAAPGADLTPLGVRQAQALVPVLRDRGVAAVYASTLVRTQQTAAPLAAALGLDVRVRAGLREVSAGDLEMACDHDSVMAYLGTVLRWGDGDLTARVPGGEDGATVLARFDAVVDEAAAAGDVVVVVSHGAVIRAWVASRCPDVDPADAARHGLSNTGAVTLAGAPGRWRLVDWHADALGGIDDRADDGAAADTVPSGAVARP